MGESSQPFQGLAIGVRYVCHSNRTFIDNQKLSAGAPPANPKQPPPANAASQPSYYTPPSNADMNGFHAITRNGSHSRDVSWARGHVHQTAVTNPSVLQAQHGGPPMSPRSQTPVGSNRSPGGVNDSVERRPSLSQNHYRHASKAHGPTAHSRNTSFVNSPATSPLSPFVPAPGAVAEFPNILAHQHGYLDSRPSETGTIASNLLQSSAITSSTHQEGNDTVNTGLTKKRIERSGGNQTRRGHSHHRSQAKNQQVHEQKTVDEWTLDHLFTSVGRFQSDEAPSDQVVVRRASRLQGQSMRIRPPRT